MKKILLLCLLAGCPQGDAPDDAAPPPLQDAPTETVLPFVIGAAAFRPLADPGAPQLSADEFGWGPTWRFGSPPSRVIAPVAVPNGCRATEVRVTYNKGYLGGGALSAQLNFRSGDLAPAILGVFEDRATGDGQVRVGRIIPSPYPVFGELYLIVSGNIQGSWLIYTSGTMTCEKT